MPSGGPEEHMLQVEIDNEVLWGGSLPNLNGCSETEDPFEGEPGRASEFWRSSPLLTLMCFSANRVRDSQSDTPSSHTHSVPRILPNLAGLVQHVPGTERLLDQVPTSPMLRALRTSLTFPGSCVNVQSTEELTLMCCASGGGTLV